MCVVVLVQRRPARTLFDHTQVMLKLKNAKNLDPRLAMLVDHAFLCVKPPVGGVGARAKQRPPEQRYVEMLLLQRLDRRTTPKVRCCCVCDRSTRPATTTTTTLIFVFILYIISLSLYIYILLFLCICF